MADEGDGEESHSADKDGERGANNADNKQSKSDTSAHDNEVQQAVDRVNQEFKNASDLLRDFYRSLPDLSTGAREYRPSEPRLVDPEELNLLRDFDIMKGARDAGIDTAPLEQYRSTIGAASYFGISFYTVSSDGSLNEHTPITSFDQQVKTDWKQTGAVYFTLRYGPPVFMGLIGGTAAVIEEIGTERYDPEAVLSGIAAGYKVGDQIGYYAAGIGGGIFGPHDAGDAGPHFELSPWQNDVSRRKDAN